MFVLFTVFLLLRDTMFVLLTVFLFLRGGRRRRGGRGVEGGAPPRGLVAKTWSDQKQIVGRAVPRALWEIAL